MSLNDQPASGRLNLQPANKNLLLRSHYRFNLNKIPNTTFFCTSANIPSSSIYAVDQGTNFNPVKRPGGNVTHSNFRINFLVDANLANYKELFTWIKQCSDYVDFDVYQEPSKHLSSEGVLTILHASNVPKYRVNFDGMFPVSIGEIRFDSGTPDSEQISCEVEFAFTSYTITAL